MLNVQIPLVPTAVRVRQGLLGMEQRAKVVFLKKLLNCTQMRKGNSHWELALPHHFCQKKYDQQTPFFSWKKEKIYNSSKLSLKKQQKKQTAAN